MITPSLCAYKQQLCMIFTLLPIFILPGFVNIQPCDRWMEPYLRNCLDQYRLLIKNPTRPGRFLMKIYSTHSLISRLEAFTMRLLILEPLICRYFLPSFIFSKSSPIQPFSLIQQEAIFSVSSQYHFPLRI